MPKVGVVASSEELSETQKTLLELTRKLESARLLYDEAAQNLKVARSNECTAQNRLNGAQNEFDDFVSSLKREAPLDSNWKKEQRYANNVSVKQ